jgi:hypothetical protein
MGAASRQTNHESAGPVVATWYHMIQKTKFSALLKEQIWARGKLWMLQCNDPEVAGSLTDPNHAPVALGFYSSHGDRH